MLQKKETNPDTLIAFHKKSTDPDGNPVEPYSYAFQVTDYSFYFTNENFEVVDKLNLHLSHSRSSFQDFCVTGDYIISIPYMQREGNMNIIDIYSISEQHRVGSYYLTLPDFCSTVEPEGICELESEHFLLGCAMLESNTFKFYETYISTIYDIETSAENGTITESSNDVSKGDSFTVDYSCDEFHRLKQLLIDGIEEDIQKYPGSYTFSDIQANHSIQVFFEELPQYSIQTIATNGSITPTLTVYEGYPATIEFSSDILYELNRITLDGVSLKIPSMQHSCTIENIHSNHLFEVEFQRIPSLTITPNKISIYLQKIKSIPFHYFLISSVLVSAIIVSFIRYIHQLRIRRMHRKRMLALRKKRLEESQKKES